MAYDAASLRAYRAASLTLALATSTLASAQIDRSTAATPTRPIAQPSFVAPSALQPKRPLLPSGPYHLSITLPPNNRATSHSVVDEVTVTNTGSALDITVTNGSLGAGQSFTGTIDASGAMNVSIPAQNGFTLELQGQATADGATGEAVVSPQGTIVMPRGAFDLIAPGLPQARARSSGFVEAVNALLHAIGCWAHGGAGC